jgi:trehalose 6-phosphate synthase
MPSQAADQRGEDLESLCADLAANRHLIVASNRGPVWFTETASGHPATSGFAGGDLSHLRGLMQLTWISAAVSGSDRAVAGQAQDDMAVPGMPDGWSAQFVSTPRRVYHRFYNTICNPLLWFLHHRSWGFTHTPNIDREAHSAWTQGMVPVSQALADAIVAEAKRASRPVAIMLQDYHMHLVGGMVRQSLPGSVIHYSLNVPWPDPSEWTMLPRSWRSEIFRSLLSCDVVGFKSERDVRSFAGGAREFVPGVQIEADAGTITTDDGHKVLLRVYPPAVETDSLVAAANSRRTLALEERIHVPGIHTFVTAERAEPYKNIVRGIRAYGAMLAANRDLAAKTRYLLALAPPPPHLAQYRRYIREIEMAVKEVNGQHGRRDGGPVQLAIENNYSLALAAMRVADTLVAIPLADANCATAFSVPLINRRNASMILSENSAAGDVFGSSATVVSPADMEHVSERMQQAARSNMQDRELEFRKLESLALGISQRDSVTGQMRDMVSVIHR